MDVNLLDRKFECNSATAAIANTAAIASSPAPIANPRKVYLNGKRV
ncbi:MAG: hypothetical protein ACR5LA_07105 [Wolbachia sp.]